jgi:hypothetical protein
MIIRTPEKSFAVVQVLRSEQDEEICVCRELDGGGELSTLARFRSPALKQELLPMLAREQSNPAFEDFLGLFTQNGDLCARFRFTQAPTLRARLDRGDLTFRERLEIGSGVLTRMTLLNMPALLQYEALQERNVTVDDALRVRFNYDLGPMAACFNRGMGFVCLQVQEILKALFAPELEAQSVPELLPLLNELEQTVYTDYLSIYRRYDGIRRALELRTGGAPAQPQTWLFRMWDRVKALRRFVRPIAAGLVLIAAFCYLLYSLQAPKALKGTPVTFTSIGTVEIRSGR